jgi:tRNA nucleotidyltransferase (CCA-adding enzyme)
MGVKEILKEELERIVPSNEEILNLDKSAKNFISLLKSKGLIAFVGGSLAKGTMIKKNGKQDVDIFVVFDYSEKMSKLESVLSKIKLPGELKKVHGSRDYFQIECSNVVLEVIPVVRNEDPELAENVTDVSLSHVKYVRSQIAKNLAISDEIKLAKAFCRANRCYGAESYVRGFSGYSLEVLVIYFGGFLKFLKGVQRRKVIDPLKQFKKDTDVMRELNASKLQGPLVLVDPTFKYRNVTAGLGFETYGRFVEVANAFLKKPSISFFESKKTDIERLKVLAKSKKAKFIEIDLTTDRQEGDIAGTKMRKFLDFFSRELMRKQQKVLDKEFEYSGKGKKAKGYLVVLEAKEIEIKGPNADLTDAVKSFLKSRGRTAYKKKNYMWAKEKVSVKDIFLEANKIGKEMGARGNLKI